MNIYIYDTYLVKNKKKKNYDEKENETTKKVAELIHSR